MMSKTFKIGHWYLLCCFSASLANAQESASTSDPSLSLVFVGDIMGHIDQIRSAEMIPDSVYDYQDCFEYVAPILKEADLAIGNLELTLPGKPPYTGYPNFKSPDALAEALADSGFDLLLTANNHSADAGSNGIVHTIEVLEEQQLFQTGTFRDTQERALLYPLIVYRKGFKLAFLNYTYGTNGVRVKAPHFVNMIDEQLIARDIAEAKALKPDFIIAVMHWGEEYQTNFNRRQEKLAKSMIEQGVDLIVGGHPHVVQPIRWYSRKGEGEKKSAMVAYSLGNFISGQTYPFTDGGIILKVVLEKNTDTYIRESDYFPVWRQKIWIAGKEKPLFRVLPIPKTGETTSSPADQFGQVAWKAMQDYRIHVVGVMEGRVADNSNKAGEKSSAGQTSN